MEQKKILWIVAAVSVFVLVIFGFALVIYSPPRTAETERQMASAAVPADVAEIARRNAAAVDPDSWVKNPEATPGLDTEIVPSPQAESLTAINSAYVARESEAKEEKSANPAAETINVRDLAASRPQQEERTARPQAAASEAQGSAARRSDVAAPAVAVSPARSETPARVAPQPAQASSSRSSSSASSAKQTVVEYWIQTGSFSSKLNAESARKMLTERYLNAEIFTKEINGRQTYRVRVGPYADKEEADYWLGTIAETPEFSGSYVSRVTAQR